MSDGSGAPKSPFTRPGFIAAVAVIAVVVLVGMIAVVSGLLSRQDPGPTPTETATATATADPDAPTADDLSVCGLEGFERTSSLDAAPENDWELVGTIAAPTSGAAGPGVVDDGFRSCFAHTAEGALYAAVNFLAIGTDDTIRPRLPELVAEGPGRDAAEEALASGSGGGIAGPRAQVAGFRIGSYDGTNVTVDLALNYNDGRLISAPLKLVWEDGDWKMVLTDTGALPLDAALLSNLGGYIPWAGA